MIDILEILCNMCNMKYLYEISNIESPLQPQPQLNLTYHVTYQLNSDQLE